MGWRGGLHRAGECTPPRPEAKQNAPAGFLRCAARGHWGAGFACRAGVGVLA